ncbi:uncharacterized protein LOC121416603 [Lytechinus variegatus]|uniref:uncharacterized protein LOC121416603 n=1 Tax=Lytechinus variegatus TaxID=7654 RepID=UPI001BB29DDB|nr:uncharacterized protein LOC121416603 [Lytechinus variegatus]
MTSYVNMVIIFSNKLDTYTNPQIMFHKKMRELGRLLQECKLHDVNSEKFNASVYLIDPGNFDDVIKGVKRLAGFNVKTMEFTTPTLAKKVGHSLRGMSEVLHAIGIKKSDHTMQGTAKGFQNLYDHEWSKKITRHVLRQMKKTKWQKGKNIPFTEDTVKLNETLATDMEEAKTNLQQEVNIENWRGLCEVTLAQAIVFNRRRPGDTQHLEVQDFKSQMKEGIMQHDEIFASLSPAEKIAASRLNLVMVRGKRDRGVPILLTKEMTECVNILIEQRDRVGINEDNPFVFACLGNSLNPLRGHDCIRRFASSCGAKHPDLLTATKVIKHIATCSQVLNLSGNELEQLANFLGHNIHVHREYYRLPQETIFLAKVSKLLLAAEKGNLSTELSVDMSVKEDNLGIGSDCEAEVSHEAEADLDAEDNLQSADDSMNEDDDDKNKECLNENQGACPKPGGVKPFDRKRKKSVGKSSNKRDMSVLSKRKKSNGRKTWSKEEEKAVFSHPDCSSAIANMCPPSFATCARIKDKSNCLKDRSIIQIKSKIWNAILKEKNRDK